MQISWLAQRWSQAWEESLLGPKVQLYDINGSIYRGKNEASSQLIALRGRGGFLLGLELKTLQQI